MFSFLPSLKALLSISMVLILTPNGLNGRIEKITCFNNGTLIEEEDNRQLCKCPSPFTGRQCEDYDCVNGLATGGQYDPNSLFFDKHCLCDSGWTGELCDESLVNRCGENGKDVKGKCACKPNFVGDRCEFVIKCTNGQLYNGRCSCHYGWAGDFCDEIICHQGKPDIRNEKCICPSKYRGKHCDFCAEPASSPPPECAASRLPTVDGKNFPLLTIVVIAVILVIAGPLIYILCCKMSRTKALKRQTTTDVESNLPGNVTQTCPLRDSTQITSEGSTMDSEKFHDAPPPYETLTLAQKENKVKIELFDSGFADPEDVAGASNSNSGAIEETSEEAKVAHLSKNASAVIVQNERFSDDAKKATTGADVYKGSDINSEFLSRNGNAINVDQSRNGYVPLSCEFDIAEHGPNEKPTNPKEEVTMDSDSEVFYEVPTSPTIVHVQLQMKKHEELPDSGFSSLKDASGGSRRNSGEVAENGEAALKTKKNYTLRQNAPMAIEQLRVRFSDEAAEAGIDTDASKNIEKNSENVETQRSATKGAESNAEKESHDHENENNAILHQGNDNTVVTSHLKAGCKSEVVPANIHGAEKVPGEHDIKATDAEAAQGCAKSNCAGLKEELLEMNNGHRQFVVEQNLDHLNKKLNLADDSVIGLEQNANGSAEKVEQNAENNERNPNQYDSVEMAKQ